MKILSIVPLYLPEIKVIRFARFGDGRGYFTEPFRLSDLRAADAATFGGVEMVQANESFSRGGVARGLHFQWNPPMGKLVRTLSGRMVDIAMDIRRDSSTLGAVALYDMPAPRATAEWDEWIWVPPGFAHGNYFPEDTRIEYLCTGEYNPDCEAAVSPLSPGLVWPEADSGLSALCREALPAAFMSAKDKDAPTLAEWLASPRSANFWH